MFKAILIDKGSDGKSSASLAEIQDDALPQADVTIDVEFSTLNYKDALAITGRSPVVRQFPMVPGIDLAGIVKTSKDERYAPGDRVLLNGWGVGETHWGGISQKACVMGDWLLKLPQGLTTRQAMAIGTAGYTAMLGIIALERLGVGAASGPVLVTGANGGVGTFAVWLLAKSGYTVIASTGRLAESDHLLALGASEVLDRRELENAGKPLQKERWFAALDCVGSHTLANVCAGTKYGGVVAACGLAQGMDFPSTVAPFILRGVSLIGIDSVYAPRAAREAAWNRLAELIPESMVETNTSEIALSNVCESAVALLDGRIRGRVVIDVNKV